MKKATVILLTMLLVLILGQAALAQASVGVRWAYDFKTRDYSEPGYTGDGGYDVSESFLISLSGKYAFTNNIAIAAKFDYSIGTYYYDDWNGDIETIMPMHMNAHLFGKYTIFGNDIFSVGAELGGIYDYDYKYFNYDEFSYTRHALFGAIGVFGNVSVSPLIDIYADVKVPVYVYAFGKEYDAALDAETDLDDYNGFFNTFFYDVTVGASYQVNPNARFGVEINVSNSTNYRIEIEDTQWWSGTEMIFEGSIGMKLEYTF